MKTKIIVECSIKEDKQFCSINCPFLYQYSSAITECRAFDYVRLMQCGEDCFRCKQCIKNEVK